MIVSELSRLGRSVSEVIRLTGEIIQKGIKIICVKENITFDQSADITSEIMRKFGLFAQMERYLISERTKIALQAAKDKGKQLGRRPGKRPQQARSLQSGNPGVASKWQHQGVHRHPVRFIRCQSLSLV